MNHDDDMDGRAELAEDDAANMFPDGDEDVVVELMMESLMMACVVETEAVSLAQKMLVFKFRDPAAFFEVSGRSLFGQSQLERRNVRHLAAQRCKWMLCYARMG